MFTTNSTKYDEKGNVIYKVLKDTDEGTINEITSEYNDDNITSYKETLRHISTNQLIFECDTNYRYDGNIVCGADTDIKYYRNDQSSESKFSLNFDKPDDKVEKRTIRESYMDSSKIILVQDIIKEDGIIKGKSFNKISKVVIYSYEYQKKLQITTTYFKDDTILYYETLAYHYTKKEENNTISYEEYSKVEVIGDNDYDDKNRLTRSEVTSTSSVDNSTLRAVEEYEYSKDNIEYIRRTYDENNKETVEAHTMTHIKPFEQNITNILHGDYFDDYTFEDEECKKRVLSHKYGTDSDYIFESFTYNDIKNYCLHVMYRVYTVKPKHVKGQPIQLNSQQVARSMQIVFYDDNKSKEPKEINRIEISGNADLENLILALV